MRKEHGGDNRLIAKSQRDLNTGMKRHVIYHALWATDFAVMLINKMYPGNLEEVKKERGMQISLLQSV
jgi:hypothetical protein